MQRITRSIDRSNPQVSASGKKRPASDSPSGTSEAEKRQRVAACQRDQCLLAMGISGQGLPRAGNKTETLRQQGIDMPSSMSPVGALSKAEPSDLVYKVAAPNAGDHSPSMSAANRTLSPEFKVLGRGAVPVTDGFNVHANIVPTLQFTTTAFGAAGDEHLGYKDAAAHTAFTSLREMHGAGEKSVSADKDSLLDNTAHAYSPYNALGDSEKLGVNLPKVNVHSENQNGPELHKTKQGVDPLIAQQMINLWYRWNTKPDTVPGTIPSPHPAFSDLTSPPASE